MDLRSYLELSGRGAAAALARAIGVSPVMVSQWTALANPKPVPLDRCRPIQVATHNLVMPWDLRPDDWHVHWPELAHADGAPPVRDRQPLQAPAA